MYFAAKLALIACWLCWAYPFVFRAPHNQRRPSITAALPTHLGLILETAAVLLAVMFRLPAGNPPSPARVVASMLLGPAGAAMAWAAVKHLGRQFRIQAGVYADHRLVRTGPYSLVRHPIYASALAMLLSTSLLLTPWRWMAVCVAVFIAGTEIRIHAEEKLLAERFGEEFQDYKRRVPAFVPFFR